MSRLRFARIVCCAANDEAHEVGKLPAYPVIGQVDGEASVRCVRRRPRQAARFGQPTAGRKVGMARESLGCPLLVAAALRAWGRHGSAATGARGIVGDVRGLGAATTGLGSGAGAAEFDDLIEAARDSPDPEEVALLARVLAASGFVRPLQSDAADVASTGGPGSLTTILCPPMLRANGLTVPKVGVPGRPAGGVDSLGVLSGYHVDLDADAFERVLAECGYVHALAGRDLAPLDRVFFAYRQARGAQAVVALVAASLLAKKIAVGVARVGLDLRVGTVGNIASDLDAAEAAARLIVDAGNVLGIQVHCVLTDSSHHRQPFIGRGEALVGLSISLGLITSPGWLRSITPLIEKHEAECFRLARMAGGTEIETTQLALQQIVAANLNAQGSSKATLVAKARRVVTALSGGAHRGAATCSSISKVLETCSFMLA